MFPSATMLVTIPVYFLLHLSSVLALPNSIESVVSTLHSITNHTTPFLKTLHAPLLGALLQKRDNTTNSTDSTTSTNSSDPSVWILEDTYAGQTFFNDWTFFTGADPTHGLVTYVNQSTAFADGLAYVNDNNTVIMKGDDTNTLPMGTNRNSVRITSNTLYTGGLFILDINQAPWGCGVWPAFWTVGDNWPYQGEIDILEGVHNNMNNQVTWHTMAGCNLTLPGNFTGTPVGQTDCNALINNNAGCGVIEWSKASYGDEFDATGGGVFAMKWDEDGIAIWNFYRVSIPEDITNGTPDPDSWTVPSAALSPDGCDPFTYFVNHSIVFDITFCGDWAGNTYDTTPGCAGTCPEALQDPSNFVNASWSINSLKVYRKQDLTGVVTDHAQRLKEVPGSWIISAFVLLCAVVQLAGVEML